MDDTLPDEAYLDGLRDGLADIDPALEPADDGIGIVATSLMPVLDGAWPELEVTWSLTLPELPELATVPREGTFRVPFGRTWLELSFYPNPSDYVQLVRMRLEGAAQRALRHADRPQVSAPLPDPRRVADLWPEFLAELEDWGETVREVGLGRVEVESTTEEGQPRILTFLITPEEWAALRVRGHGEYGLGELIGAADQDERFFRYAGTGFTHSIREQLPPVRGAAVLRKIAAIRARNPDAKFYWSAEMPEVSLDPSPGEDH